MTGRIRRRRVREPILPPPALDERDEWALDREYGRRRVAAHQASDHARAMRLSIDRNLYGTDEAIRRDDTR